MWILLKHDYQENIFTNSIRKKIQKTKSPQAETKDTSVKSMTVSRVFLVYAR